MDYYFQIKKSIYDENSGYGKDINQYILSIIDLDINSYHWDRLEEWYDDIEIFGFRYELDFLAFKLRWM